MNSPFPYFLLARVTLNNTEKLSFSTFMRNMMLVETPSTIHSAAEYWLASRVI
jgi:hypothetical protein